MYLDILLLIIALFFGVWGLIQGFSRQLVSLIVWVSVILFAYPSGQWIKSSLTWKSVKECPDLVMWGIVSVIFIGLGLMLSHYLSRWTLSPTVDRWMGFCLGAAKGLVISFSIAALFQLIPTDSREELVELNHEVERSQFVTASSHMLQWDISSSIKAFRKAKEKIEIGTGNLVGSGEE